MLNITFITYTHITCSFIGKYICKLTLIKVILIQFYHQNILFYMILKNQVPKTN